jgi:Recombination endonuclease VII
MPRSQDGRWQVACVRCGKEFEQLRGQQHCSQECANKDSPGKGGRKPAAALEPRTCPVCGEQFQPYRANQLACSPKHRKQLPEIRERENARRRDDPAFKERKNEWRRTTPAQVERIRTYNRKQVLARYGLTPGDYERMLSEQGGRCAICGSEPKPDGIRAESKLHADHDHATGRHRDLLCSNCNKGLGCFKDDPAVLRVAAGYIERHKEHGVTDS